MGFQYAFGVCHTNLKIVGLWPGSINSKFNGIIPVLLLTITIFIMITFVTMAQTTKLLMIWGDLGLMINNLSTANLPITVVIIKTILFYNYKRELGMLLSSVINDWNADKTKGEVINMVRNAKTTRKLSFICLFLGMGSVNGQLAVRISQELDILPGQINKREPMLISYFPYDYKPSPIYEITWLFQYLGAILATLIYSGIYCFFVGLVLHLRGQLANLRFRLETLDIDGNKANHRKITKKIGFIVERHNILNRFAKEIENVFNGIFLVEIISCTVLICLQLFLLVTLISDDNKDINVPILQIVFTVTYVMHVGTHVLISCYVADKLQDESSAISQSAYNIQWYNMASQNSKLLLMIMQRSEKPLKLTAGKFCSFSLLLFIQILKTSGGYLSMLLAVKEKI
ncbi:odorant receptor 4-like [Copidosoma floridanum]|uniref:odorant receptor 4-like n=1 Tax=Copidosoma floridanum TaxID=29053 RepID=UPI0006C9A527|nr:odorant receptor 4-like [Copidosoma floridanum]